MYLLCRYGYKTWEWRYGLRSYFYPGVFALVYKVLGVLHMDSRLLLVSIFKIIYASRLKVHLHWAKANANSFVTLNLILYEPILKWCWFRLRPQTETPLYTVERAVRILLCCHQKNKEKMGLSPILSIIHTTTIGTMLNFKGGNNRHVL